MSRCGVKRLLAWWSGVGLLACAARPTMPPDQPLEKRLEACKSGASECVPRQLQAPPMVVGPGRVRALLAGFWSAGDPGSPEFALVEVDEQGVQVLTEDRCVGALVPKSLGRTRAGESAIVCQHFNEVQFGVFDPTRRRIDWRWTQTLDEDAMRLAPVAYFADLGSSVVLVYRLAPTKGVPLPSWDYSIAPGPGKHGNICIDCDIVSLVVVDEQLHVLSGGTRPFQELVIVEHGADTRLEPLKTAPFVAGTLPAPCVAQGRDGAVTVRVPLFVKYTDGKPDPNSGRTSSIATLRYEHACLAHGPDVYPSEDLPCPPQRFTDRRDPRCPSHSTPGLARAAARTPPCSRITCQNARSAEQISICPSTTPTTSIQGAFASCARPRSPRTRQ